MISVIINRNEGRALPKMGPDECITCAKAGKVSRQRFVDSGEPCQAGTARPAFGDAAFNPSNRKMGCVVRALQLYPKKAIQRET